MTMKLKINPRNEGVKITSVREGCRAQLPHCLDCTSGDYSVGKKFSLLLAVVQPGLH